MTDRLEQEARSFVVFRAGGEEYGLSIERVQSIIRYEEPTPIPRAPELVMGVINMRGQVIPVVDLARRFGRERFVPGPASRIVVTEGPSGSVGLAVDAANEVAMIANDDIKDAPESVLTAETADAFEGVVNREDGLVILVDLDNALPRTEYGRATGDSEPEGGTDV